MGLHLKRNHIIYNKLRIEETLPPDQYPEIYYRPTPPEMPADYMARSDEIRGYAKAALEAYRQDENYRFLQTWTGRLNKNQERNICLTPVLGYAKGLALAIEKDDLVTMRRHKCPDRFIESFHECAERIRALQPAENEQMTLGIGTHSNLITL